MSKCNFDVRLIGCYLAGNPLFPGRTDRSLLWCPRGSAHYRASRLVGAGPAPQRADTGGPPALIAAFFELELRKVEFLGEWVFESHALDGRSNREVLA